MIFELTPMSFGIIVLLVCAFVFFLFAFDRNDWPENRALYRKIGRLFFILGVGLLLFDQYRLHRGFDFSIEATELSDTELFYRELAILRKENKIAQEQERQDKINDLEKRLEEIK